MIMPTDFAKKNPRLTPQRVHDKFEHILSKNYSSKCSPSPFVRFYNTRLQFGIRIAFFMHQKLLLCQYPHPPKDGRLNKQDSLKVIFEFAYREGDFDLFRYLVVKHMGGSFENHYLRVYVAARLIKSLGIQRKMTTRWLKFFIDHIENKTCIRGGLSFTRWESDFAEACELLDTGRYLLQNKNHEHHDIILSMAKKYNRVAYKLLNAIVSQTEAMKHDTEAEEAGVKSVFKRRQANVYNRYMMALLPLFNEGSSNYVAHKVWDNLPHFCNSTLDHLIPVFLKQIVIGDISNPIFTYPCYRTPRAFNYFIHDVMNTSVTAFLTDFPYGPVQEYCMEMMTNLHSDPDEIMSCAITLEQFDAFMLRLAIIDLKKEAEAA